MKGRAQAAAFYEMVSWVEQSGSSLQMGLVCVCHCATKGVSISAKRQGQAPRLGASLQ